nr:hypothetical protein [uncultured Comamonas sp.]
MYGVINFNKIDTTPGSSSAFAPPTGFDGDYRAFLIRRMNTDKGVHQHVATVARMYRAGSTPPVYLGPYADIAAGLMQRVWTKMHASSEADKARRQALPDAL